MPPSRRDPLEMIRALAGAPTESEIVEFKVDNSNPVEIGEYISALANSAALVGKPRAWMAWGVTDESHDLVGTNFRPATAKYGNENLENWLGHVINPRTAFTFQEVDDGPRHFVLLTIEAADKFPVSFQGDEWIRVGSYKKKLREHPEREQELWQRLSALPPFDVRMAVDGVSDEDVVRLLDVQHYFDRCKRPMPATRDAILEDLATYRLISRGPDGWAITNTAALLLAKDLATFPSLGRKALRVVRYQHNDRTAGRQEKEFAEGYARTFAQAVDWIIATLPSEEALTTGREDRTLVPRIAITELLANAMIHQDLEVGGAGALVELFDDRFEITNPGASIVPAERMLDGAAHSRNEHMARTMRAMFYCDERGSGIDKVETAVAMADLPAPIIDTGDDWTRVILLGPRPVTALSKDERIWGVFIHVCLRHANREAATNSTIRDRFGIPPQNSAIASRLIKEATVAGAIVIEDERVGYKARRYLPAFAAPRSAARK